MWDSKRVNKQTELGGERAAVISSSGKGPLWEDTWLALKELISEVPEWKYSREHRGGQAGAWWVYSGNNQESRVVTGGWRRESSLRKGKEREQVHTGHLVSVISRLIIQGRDDGLRAGW